MYGLEQFDAVECVGLSRQRMAERCSELSSQFRADVEFADRCAFCQAGALCDGNPRSPMNDKRNTGARGDRRDAILIEAFIDADIRDDVQIMVGGAPVTQEFSDDMGADGYGADALSCVAVAKELIAAAKAA